MFVFWKNPSLQPDGHKKMHLQTRAVSLAQLVVVAGRWNSTLNVSGLFSLIQGVYFGVGVGSGKLMAGLLIGSYGAVVTFQIYAACCAVVLVLFAIAQKVEWSVWTCCVSVNDVLYGLLDKRQANGPTDQMINHTPTNKLTS